MLEVFNGAAINALTSVELNDDTGAGAGPCGSNTRSLLFVHRESRASPTVIRVDGFGDFHRHLHAAYLDQGGRSRPLRRMTISRTRSRSPHPGRARRLRRSAPPLTPASKTASRSPKTRRRASRRPRAPTPSGTGGRRRTAIAPRSRPASTVRRTTRTRQSRCTRALPSTPSLPWGRATANDAFCGPGNSGSGARAHLRPGRRHGSTGSASTAAATPTGAFTLVASGRPRARPWTTAPAFGSAPVGLNAPSLCVPDRGTRPPRRSPALGHAVSISAAGRRLRDRLRQLLDRGAGG